MAEEQTARLKNIRIGDVLKESGYVNDEQIGQALRYQKEHKGMRLGGALIELGFISETNMLQALAIRLNMKHIDIANVKVHLDATALIPANLAEKYCILAINDCERPDELFCDRGYQAADRQTAQYLPV